MFALKSFGLKFSFSQMKFIALRTSFQNVPAAIPIGFCALATGSQPASIQIMEFSLRAVNRGAAGVVAGLLFLISCVFAPLSAAEPLLGVEVIDEPLPLFDPTDNSVRLPRETDEFPPLRVLLSRERYWAQDGHMDVIVQLAGTVNGHLAVTIRGAGGERETAFTIDPLPGAAFIFYPRIPAELMDGGEGTIEIQWVVDGQAIATEDRHFRVVRFAEPVERTGAVPLTIPNPAGVVESAVPVTVGVPFPRGVLRDAAHLRLVDGDGREIPLQVNDTNRWSKFGTLRWILCDFTVDLDGGPKELYLEYGPALSRSDRLPLRVEPGAAFPAIDAGRLRIDGGVWFDVAGDGNYVKVLDEEALSGAFVEHEDGRFYHVPVDHPFEVEETGAEKIVLRREGWYQNADAADINSPRFCKFITRLIVHRDSPVLRIFHTWIFTGNDKRDRIRNMGWQFPLADGVEPGAFLTEFGDGGEWLGGDLLLQWDYEHFLVADGLEVERFDGGRSAGVAAAGNEEVEVYFGFKDFWQNYPSELEFAGGSFWFHNWPRHNLSAGHTFDKEWLVERTEPIASSSAARYAMEDPAKLSRSEWKMNILQHRYAHEGPVLDFSLPQIFAEPPLSWTGDHSFAIENFNAQGISRTEEMWIYFRAPDPQGAAVAEPLMRGMNDETLRAVVDPEWLVMTDAIHGIHPVDREQFPAAEHSYELAALSFGTLAEKLGSYGMWIYGDIPAWNPHPALMLPSLYRAFQKQHLGWPYSWIPYARSGDSRFLKTAEANTRQIIDAAYVHYIGDDLADVRKHRGYWGVGPVYWGRGTNPAVRGTFNTVENLVHAWNMTGYHRAADHIRYIMEVFKEVPLDKTLYGRGTNAELKSYVDIYEETYDPWFLAAAHAISRGHMYGPTPEFLDRIYGGRMWETGDREFLRLTDDTEFRDKLYLGRIVPVATSEYEPDHYNRRVPQYPPKVHAWRITGDDYYLRRVAAAVELGTALIGDGEMYPEYQIGYLHRNNCPRPVTGGDTDYTVFTGQFIRWLPLGLRALSDAGYWPDSIANSALVSPVAVDRDDDFNRATVVTIRKDTNDQPIPLRFRSWSNHWSPGPLSDDIVAEYRVVDQDGDVVTSGTWNFSDRPYARGINMLDAEIPASVPAGVYQLEVLFQGAGAVAIPITGRDTPEVFKVEPGQTVAAPNHGSTWFMVPDGVESFWIDVRPDKRGLSMVWNPSGERVWNQGDHWLPIDDPQWSNNFLRAEIDVPDEHAGKLWRITYGGNFRIDPQIPHVFSTEPRRWFEGQ